MTAELRTRMILDLEGGYASTVKSWDQTTQKFLSGTQSSLGVAQRAWGVFGGKLDSIGNSFWTRAAGAGGLALMGRQAATFDESVTRIGINANVSADRMERFKKQLFEIADRPDVNVKVDDLAAGMAAIVEKTGDLEFASKNMLNVGRFMQATGENAEDIGELIGNIHTFGVQAPDDILKVVGAWDEMGKKSGLSLKEMINKGQEVLTLYQQMGRTGPDALKEVGALMALATKQLGSPRLATGASTELLEGLRQNLGLTVGLGITDTSGHLKVTLDEAIKKIITTYRGYAPTLQTIFGQGGETMLTPLINEYKSGKPMDALKQFIDVQSDGTQVIQDAATAAQTAAESFNKLFDEYQKFGDSNLSKDLKGIGAEINSINPATMQTVFKGVEYGAGGLLALYGARKAWGLGKDIWKAGQFIFGGGKKGGLMGEISDMAGVQRVFVVNMGGGMGGATWGGGEPNWAGGAAAGGASRLATAARWGGGIVAAGGAGYAVGTAIHDYLLTDQGPFGTKMGDSIDQAIGSGIAHVFSLFSDDVKQTINQRNSADATSSKGKDSNINMVLSFDAQGNPYMKRASSDNKNINVDFDYKSYGGLARFNP